MTRYSEADILMRDDDGRPVAVRCGGCQAFTLNTVTGLCATCQPSPLAAFLRTDTHFVPFWQRPNAEGIAAAICGAEIAFPSQHSALPACPQCEAYFEMLEPRR